MVRIRLNAFLASCALSLFFWQSNTNIDTSDPSSYVRCLVLAVLKTQQSYAHLFGAVVETPDRLVRVKLDFITYAVTKSRVVFAQKVQTALDYA